MSSRKRGSILSYFPDAGNMTAASSATIGLKSIVIYTDGSCINNGKRGSKGGLAVVFPEHSSSNYSEKLTGVKATNNRAELLAIVRALEIVNKDIDPKSQHSVLIKTDSLLCVKTITDWLRAWKARGWKKADNQIPKNLDILKILDSLLAHRRVYIRHVAAHTGRSDPDSVYNAMADTLAKQAANSSV